MAGKDAYSDIWELYGLKSDPFNTSPLLVFGGEIPLDTFIGRGEELKRLMNLFRNKGGSRIIVSGDVGVGKTTFVNYARALAQKDGGFFTTIKEIAIQPEWSTIDFIINTLGSIFTTFERKEDVKLPSNLKKKMGALLTISEIKNISLSASVAGYGLGWGKDVTRKVPAKLNIPLLQELFEEVVASLMQKGYKGVILHYNNLELFEHEDLVKIFNGVRDFIQANNVHFIFVGGLAVPSAISSVSRVGSILSDMPVILPILALKEVETVIQRRVESLTIRGFTSEVPVDKEVIKILYDLHAGNIRYILNSLSTAFNEITAEVPVRLTAHKLRKVLYDLAKKRWLDKLSKLEQEALNAILVEQEITNRKLSNKLKKQPQNISKMTNKLLDLCAIRVKRQEGREKFFSAEPSLKWFLLAEKDQEIEKEENKAIQRALKDFFE